MLAVLESHNWLGVQYFCVLESPEILVTCLTRALILVPNKQRSRLIASVFTT
jgi:hypothetical protein